MSWIDMDRKRLFQCWSDMKQRCSNEKTSNYKDYGGRGITVCQRWLDSFDTFCLDMGEKPPNTSLDRIDVHGNYEPSNCRWATQLEQQNNRRSNRLITLDGTTLTARQWSKKLGLSEATISYRALQGYPPEMMLSKEKFLFGSRKATAAMEAK